MTAEREMFDQLRILAIEVLGVGNQEEVCARSDLAPIERTLEGWICLSEQGNVGVFEYGTFRCESNLPVSASALVGSLACRVPLASWFVPRPEMARVCPGCSGRGFLPQVPESLQGMVRCQCGGLGWIPDAP